MNLATCGKGRQTPEDGFSFRGRTAGLALGICSLLLTVPAAAQQGAVWVNPDIVGAAPTLLVPPGSVSPGPQRYRLPFNKPATPVRLTPPGRASGSSSAARRPSSSVAVAPVLARPVAPRAPVAVAVQRPVVASPTPVPAPTPLPAVAAVPSDEPSAAAPRVIRPTAPARVEAPGTAPPAPQPTRTATDIPPRQVATAAPAATAAAAANASRILFQEAATDVDAAGLAAIQSIARQLKGGEQRVEIRAFAESAAETVDWKRRLSLRRGQNVRRALLDEGVQGFRILLRALGAPTDGGPGNRVDLIIESR